MRSILIGCVFFLSLQTTLVSAQAEKSLSGQMSRRAMQRWPDSISTESGLKSWHDEHALLLAAILEVWQSTGDGKLYEYVDQRMDPVVREDGTIRGHDTARRDPNILLTGRILLTLYEVGGKAKYRKAIALLYDQLLTPSSKAAGNSSSKMNHPSQCWLEESYIGLPFYAAYANRFQLDSAFNDIATEIRLIEEHSHDTHFALLPNGRNDRKQQESHDKAIAESTLPWGNSMGWYAMALVEVLDQFPENHPKRPELINIMMRLAANVSEKQDNSTGLWFIASGSKEKKPGYLEAASSCMFTYAIAHGIRKGYLPVIPYEKVVRRAYKGINDHFIQHNDGTISLADTVSESGLPNSSNRYASVADYEQAQAVSNDPKAMGAFILCATEMEHIDDWEVGKGKRVLLDRYYNSEKKNREGNSSYFHYTWDEKSHPGFFSFGNIFQWNAAKLATLDVAPDKATLSNASVYIIVDPDHEKDNPAPNYMNSVDAKIICDWVEQGGVLLIMANDAPNSDLAHLNELMSLFGIHFNSDSRNPVKGEQFEMGALQTGRSEVFPVSRMIYMKDISTLDIKPPAKALLEEGNDVLMAIASYGKGKVFAIGDPWIYNEYIDGRRLPSGFENFEAARDLANWLLMNAKKADR